MNSEEVKLKLQELYKIIQIDMIASSSTGNNLRNKARYTKITTIALSALITIVLGLTFLNELGKWIAIIFSGILTAVNSWDAYTGYDKRVQQEIFSTNSLKNLYKDIHLYLTGNDSPAESYYIEFKRRYDEIQEQYITERKNSTDESKNTDDSANGN
ncbi:MAG: SLATT domain-containing protein [Bacillus sp. (in: firmicutes)]